MAATCNFLPASPFDLACGKLAGKATYYVLDYGMLQWSELWISSPALFVIMCCNGRNYKDLACWCYYYSADTHNFVFFGLFFFQINLTTLTLLTERICWTA